MNKTQQNRPLLALGLFLSLAGTATAQQAPAAGLPVFSPTATTGWVGIGIGALLPVPGSPKPIGQDPAHPYISNDQAGVTGQQPTQRIGDIGNPNLRQWAKDVMQKDNDAVLKGKFAYTARSACTAAGVPGFDVLLGGALYILQSPREVVMVFSGNGEKRHIYLNVPHSPIQNPRSTENPLATTKVIPSSSIPSASTTRRSSTIIARPIPTSCTSRNAGA